MNLIKNAIINLGLNIVVDIWVFELSMSDRLAVDEDLLYFYGMSEKMFIESIPHFSGQEHDIFG